MNFLTLNRKNMKTNISYAILAATAILTLGSCSEGQYWTEPADKGAVVAFAKPALSMSVPAKETAPDSYEVTLYRSQTNGDATVNVTFTTATPDVLKGNGTSVTFANGENTAKYIISIGDLMPGVNYSASLAVEQPKDILTQVDPSNLKFSFQISQQQSWTPAGKAGVLESTIIGNESPVEMQVEEGNWPIAGQRLFRITNLYYNLYPNPDVFEEGTEIRFFTDDQGKALNLFSAWSYTGYIEDGEYFYFGCPAAYGSTFTNEGNVYVMNGILGTAASKGGEVSAAYYETITFEWACPAK